MSLCSKAARLAVLVGVVAFVPSLSAGREADTRPAAPGGDGASGDRPTREPGAPRSTGPRGLRTKRLSPKQLQVWRRIAAIVLAEDGSGHPLYPTLHRLWNAVDTSGHVVHVGICEPASSPRFV